jgi:hypothetical protein
MCHLNNKARAFPIEIPPLAENEQEIRGPLSQAFVVALIDHRHQRVNDHVASVLTIPPQPSEQSSVLSLRGRTLTFIPSLPIFSRTDSAVSRNSAPLQVATVDQAVLHTRALVTYRALASRSMPDSALDTSSFVPSNVDDAWCGQPSPFINGHSSPHCYLPPSSRRESSWHEIARQRQGHSAARPQ